MLQNKCFFQMAQMCCGICSNVLTWRDSRTWCSLWWCQEPLLTCTALLWRKMVSGLFYAKLTGNQYTGHMYCSFCTGREKNLFSQCLWVSFSPPRFAWRTNTCNITRENICSYLRWPRKAIFLACSLFSLDFSQEFEKMPISSNYF